MRARSSSPSMRRDSATPVWFGTRTARRPGSSRCGKPRALLADRILDHLHRISSPSCTQSPILGVRSSSKPGRSAETARLTRAEEARAVEPTSTNAACMPGSTRCTRPSMMLPTRLWPLRPWPRPAPSSRPSVRSSQSSCRRPSSTRATRISPAPTLIRTSFGIRKLERIATCGSLARVSAAAKQRDGFGERQADHIRPRTVQSAYECFGASLDRVAAGLPTPSRDST